MHFEELIEKLITIALHFASLIITNNSVTDKRHPSIHLYLSETNNQRADKCAVGQDSETESTEHCPEYKLSIL